MSNLKHPLYPITHRPPADIRLHNRWWTSAYPVMQAHNSCCAAEDIGFSRLIVLILPITSKGYSEDFLRETDATMIALTRHDDSTHKQQR